MSLTREDILQLAVDPQRQGADPKVSAVVSANAGSGKTKTLVDRVARLLLSGARPETVLCLTFTKAAASEMQRRLFDRLGAWAVKPDAALATELALLEGRDAAAYDQGALSRARRLFAKALETPGGLKIQTIHAFCEKLLRQFPLEAGVGPGFSVLDDAGAGVIERRARESLAHISADPDGFLGAVYSRLAVKLDWGSFEDLFRTLSAKREALLAFYEAAEAEGGLDVAIARLVGQEAPMTPDAVLHAYFSPPALDVAAYFAAAAALSRGTPKTDQPNGQTLQRAAEAARNGDDPSADEIFKLFLTLDGEPRKNLATKSVDDETREWMLTEQQRLLEAREALNAARTAARTFDVISLGVAYAKIYQAAKERRGALDFSDLITKAAALLNDQPSTAWVLYKLDGGVDHILVDEAQDTAPEQWRIVKALAQEFFAGEGVEIPNRLSALERTVFVVGDRKQSIYSFQGAEPRRMAIESAHLKGMAQGAGRTFHEIELSVSWRSTAAVLAYVDQVFEDEARSEHLSPGAAASRVRHIAHRLGDPGCVDLWPLEEEDEVEATNAWEPVDAVAPSNARRRLAERIARECIAIVRRGDAVKAHAGAEARAAGYGDILVLVRKRDGLFDEILKALKRFQVPVAGADQLKLSEHLVFEDLRSLARFALYPWDDLALAEVLRSPLCDVSETDLFDLAHGRRDSLYGELRSARGAERPSWKRAQTLLGEAREWGPKLAPFEFYSRLMGRADAKGRSLRQRFITRLGPEAGEALDAFIAQTLAAEERGVRDLEQFCAELERLELTLKRELDQPKGEVRVMTAHGAKGLEAPIVFMPDTLASTPPRQSLYEGEDGGFLWLGPQGEDCRAARLLRERRAQRDEEEASRLLYVGLTRARDRLVLAGRLSRRGTVNGWRTALEAVFDGQLHEEVREVALDDGFTFRRFGEDPEPAGDTAPTPPAPTPVLPDWAMTAAKADPAALAWAQPSTHAESRRGATPSPLAAAGGIGRFRRGDLIHRLFQTLPDIQPTERAAAADRILARERDLTPEQRREMIRAALTVLEDPRFFDVFAEGSRPEVAVAGTAPDLPPGLAISGRVDRLAVRPDRVLVVDFKTNRPAPDRIENTDPAYLTQMALYVAVLRAIFVGRRIEAALVWTDGPRLMPVPENLIDQELTKLRRGG